MLLFFFVVLSVHVTMKTYNENDPGRRKHHFWNVLCMLVFLLIVLVVSGFVSFVNYFCGV